MSKAATANTSSATGSKYVMTISRMTVDKLGVKLYDRVSAVIAELVANGYDADATNVTIEAPMGHYLATMQQGKLVDSGYQIVVKDDGVGMNPEVVNPFYLKVGGERRKDAQRGAVSKKYGRRVMGRKGVGKLAPFGICGTIEVISSGGPRVEGIDKSGKKARGYKTAHFIMKRDDIMSDEDTNYSPAIGKLDDTVSPTHGTTLILSDFVRRQVPDLDSFARQLAQRFGMNSANWGITLIDSQKTQNAPDRSKEIGAFSIQTMDHTKVVFDCPDSESVDSGANLLHYKTIFPDGSPQANTKPGFFHAGRFYPVQGWVAYAKESYRDDLMAGIRIYCRGKIAAQTSVFNRKSGFTGEYQIRSYLVGELHADWLDEGDDLIQTDRRDILWSDELGQQFEKWGQEVVALLGTLSREPLKKQVYQEFLQVGNVVDRVEQAYPGERWKPVRETTMRIAKLMGERLRNDEVQDQEHVDSLVQLSLMLGPHVELDDALREAADEEHAPLAVVAKILRMARVAELSSYGGIAERRVKVIERIIDLKDDAETLEQALQESLEEAPWLINPQWSPITANQSLSTLKDEFAKFFKEETGTEIVLSNFQNSVKRPDFVMSSQDFGLQIIEIKRPKHKLTNSEWDRVQVYIEVMAKFLSLPGHEDFQNIFKRFTVTIVCDEIGLTGAQNKAFISYKEERVVEHVTWITFLRRTQQMHQDFLAEASRQRSLAVGK